jgi:hypothetical protein
VDRAADARSSGSDSRVRTTNRVSLVTGRRSGNERQYEPQWQQQTGPLCRLLPPPPAPDEQPHEGCRPERSRERESQRRLGAEEGVGAIGCPHGQRVAGGRGKAVECVWVYGATGLPDLSFGEEVPDVGRLQHCHADEPERYPAPSHGVPCLTRAITRTTASNQAEKCNFVAAPRRRRSQKAELGRFWTTSPWSASRSNTVQIGRRTGDQILREYRDEPGGGGMNAPTPAPSARVRGVPAGKLRPRPT